jgi:hypothetical protein
MKRVLVISYFYPPYSSVGATRVSKMTRYLRDAGWEPHVLTVDHCDLPSTLPIEVPPETITRVPVRFDVGSLPRALVGRRRLSSDRLLAQQAPSWALLWRAGELYRHLACFPDGQIGWWPTAARQGIELAKVLRPDVILSSSLPNTSHLVARSIAARTGIPWIAELRDMWTENHNFRRVQPLRALEQQIERRVLSSASALVTVSEVWADRLRDKYRLPTFVVPNGYDPTDYPSDVTPSREVFTLTYTGMFYNGKQRIEPLFQAVASLASRGRISPASFRLRFMGTYLGPVRACAEAHGVGAFVTIDPPVPYRESLRMQSGATGLLFLDWFSSGASGWYSAKIYEYLGAARPILAIGPGETVVARLLERTGAGVNCSTSADAAAVLDSWMCEFVSNGAVVYGADDAVRHQFQRQQAARTMADVLDGVTASRHGRS